MILTEELQSARVNSDTDWRNVQSSIEHAETAENMQQ
jgi:hypothetical protein